MTAPTFIPVIETEHLILREPRLGDFDALCAYFSDARSAFNGGPLDAEGTWRVLTSASGLWRLRGHGLWFITRKDDDTFIGFAGIFHAFDWPEPELGYGIAAGHEGRGVAFEAAMAARQAAATHFNLTRLPSFIAPDNARSIALAERMGATFERKLTLRGDISHVYRHPQVTP
ncbi:GNAT family N-acetyltransferase [Thalassococcus sp. BH17M4-6]|uniref:GNAT family N-acetyltransferase n=1 Tax=Thalassococcus sp. BH17M4-6 TaxID=3413148 RepID=UPI003BBA36DE